MLYTSSCGILMRKTAENRQEFNHHLALAGLGYIEKVKPQLNPVAVASTSKETCRPHTQPGDLGDLNQSLAGRPNHCDRFGVLTCDHSALDSQCNVAPAVPDVV